MSRRTQLADAAIATLAREGARGLTHRAVDRAAGLAEGSASYYFRSRQALLQAAVDRCAELDIVELDATEVGVADPRVPGSSPYPDSVEGLADMAAAVVQRFLTTGRERQLARYELALEATRRPVLRETLVASGALFRSMTEEALGTLGVAEPQQRAHDLAALIDGLVFDQLAGAGSRELSTAAIRETIRVVLAAFVSTPPNRADELCEGGCCIHDRR